MAVINDLITEEEIEKEDKEAAAKAPANPLLHLDDGPDTLAEESEALEIGEIGSGAPKPTPDAGEIGLDPSDKVSAA